MIKSINIKNSIFIFIFLMIESINIIKSIICVIIIFIFIMVKSINYKNCIVFLLWLKVLILKIVWFVF
jgi:hypothetical protein